MNKFSVVLSEPLRPVVQVVNGNRVHPVALPIQLALVHYAEDADVAYATLGTLNYRGVEDVSKHYAGLTITSVTKEKV